MACPYLWRFNEKNQTNGLIDKLLRSTLRGQVSVSIFDRLESARDYRHIDDLIQAIKLLIHHKNLSRFEVFNLGTGEEASIQKVLDIADAICDEKPKFEILEINKSPSSLVVNSDKIFKEIGWKSHTTLRNGIIKMNSELKSFNL